MNLEIEGRKSCIMFVLCEKELKNIYRALRKPYFVFLVLGKHEYFIL